ncbi:putative kinetochore protein NDC80-like protein [Iris pallida]|uniref:Kinetochore protein NDC80 n=1 Tax=Iris pallida TaxID=29817 RepID=A0AAX6F2S1_IRIPA|nr:putative kinetochore protein NDC80-like protein [Iris pallida]
MRGSRQQRVPKSAPSPSFDPYAGSTRRDSDASSLCSNRSNNPSAALLSDRSSQSSALRSVNAYLSSHSAPFSLKPPLPSARDITDCLRFLLSRLDFPLLDSSMEDDLLHFLKNLSCPVKVTRSVLKAPGTPHSWPPLVSLLHWLVQLARFSDQQLLDHPSFDDNRNNDLLSYFTRSYSFFICGDDDSVDELDQENLAKAQHQAANLAASVDALAKEAEDLEAKVGALRAGPSRKEALERERAMLAEDVRKFQAVVDSWERQVAGMEEKLRDWEGELEAKERENRRVCEENEGLKARVEGQAVGVRDAERMKKEMQAVERDTAEAEVGRNAMEERAWELEAELGRKVKDLEAVTEQCNQAMRKLKLGSDLQYVLNAQGSTPAEVLGIDYKTTIKPALAALSEETKKMSVSKLEELIALQQQSRDNATILKEKKACLAALQAKVEEGGARLSSLKKEVEDNASKCAIEAEKLTEEFTRKEHQLSIVESEAEEFLKSSEQNLQDATRENEEETQLCAGELLKLIDAVSEYKEYKESLTSEIKSDVAELAKFLGDVCRASAVSAITASSCTSPSLKRARYPSPTLLSWH